MTAMNPIALANALVALLTIIVALPLIRRRVGMNSWYGIRIAQSLQSEQSWYDINEYGGRLLLYWGAFIALLASSGLFIQRPHWQRYALTTTGLMLVGLFIVTIMIFRHAAVSKSIADH